MSTRLEKYFSERQSMSNVKARGYTKSGNGKDIINYINGQIS